MIRVGAGTQHKKEKKQPKIPLECFILRPKFLECICLEKTPTSFPLDTQYTRQRKRKKWSRLPKVRALCSFPAALFLSFSLSLLFPRCAFFAFVFFLSLLSRCVRACVCVRASVCLERPDLRLGVLFPSQPQVFFSCALICADFVSSLYHLASSFHSVCCIGAGYVGGPTMAMIALKCPHIEVIL